jgi:hypothetical protein
MRRFKKGEVPPLDFKRAVKKPIPMRVIQINEPFEVETLEGVFSAKAGDFLVVGILGEMYAIDQQIFYQTYDLVE